MALKRVGVIGSVNRDTIVTDDGTLTQSYGGVLYTALALAYLGRRRVETWLFGKIGEDVRDEVCRILADAPNVRVDGLKAVAQRNYRTHIRYLADGSKQERLAGAIEPLGPQDLQPPLPQLDGLLVNFITGFEISREALESLKRVVRGPVIIDIHSLTLGRKADGSRFWRRPEDWKDWVKLSDIVQMNVDEAAVLHGGFSSQDFLSEFGLKLLEMGPRAAVFTRGAEGVFAVYRGARGTEQLHVSASHPEQAVDPTGCGDVFLAGLGAHFCTTGDFESAIRFATKAACLNSRLRGVGSLRKLGRLELA